MGEIKFALKSIIITVLLILGMQTKVGQLTIEEHFETWVRTSNIAHTLQQVASGGVQAIQHVGKATTEIVSKALGNNPHVQKASRVSLDFKRSVEAEPNKKQ
jgi:hypothetical protein